MRRQKNLQKSHALINPIINITSMILGCQGLKPNIVFNFGIIP